MQQHCTVLANPVVQEARQVVVYMGSTTAMQDKSDTVKRSSVLLDHALVDELNDEEERADEGADEHSDPELSGTALHALRGERRRACGVRVAPLVFTLTLTLDEDAGGEQRRGGVGRDLDGHRSRPNSEGDGGLQLGAATLVLLHGQCGSSQPAFKFTKIASRAKLYERRRRAANNAEDG